MKVLKSLMLVLAAVVLVTAGTGLLAWWNLERLVNDLRDQISVEVSQTLGRQVRFGPIGVVLEDGQLSVRFQDVTLAGAGRTQEQQMEVKTLSLRLDARAMWRSRGRRLEMSHAVVDGLQIRLRRNAQGQWDFSDVAQRVRVHAEQTALQAKDAPQDATQWFRELRITGMHIRGARVVLEDAMLDRTLKVEDLEVRFSDVVPGQDLSVDVALNLLDGTTTAPFSTHVDIKPLPLDLDLLAVPKLNARMKLDGLPLETWASLVPAGWVRPRTGKVFLDVDARTDPQDQSGTVHGQLKVVGLQLEDGDALGRATDVDLALDMDGSLRDSTVNLHRLRLVGAGLTLSTQVEWQGRQVDGLQRAVVDLAVADVADLVNVVPRGSTYLPQGLSVAGPLQLKLNGNARVLDVQLNLDATHVAYADWFEKAAAVPLHAEAHVERSAERINLAPLRLVLGPSTFTADMEYPIKGGPWSGRFQSGDVDLATLKSLVPLLRRKGEPWEAQGWVRVFAAADVVEGQQQWGVDVGARALKVVLPRFRLRGDARAFAQRRAQGPQSAQWSALVDATQLSVQLKDEHGQRVFKKQRGMVLEAHADAVEQGTTLQVRQAVMSLGSSFVQAAGGVVGLGQSETRVTAQTEALNVEGADLVALFPAAARLPGNSALTGRLVVEGSTQRPPSWTFSGLDVDVVLGRSRLEGAFRVEGVETPRVWARAQRLVVDGRDLRRVTADGRVPLGQLVAAGVAEGASDAPESWRVQVDSAEGQLWGMRWSGSGTVQDLHAPRFSGTLQADRVDVDDLQARLAAWSTPRGNSTGQQAWQRAEGTLTLTTPWLRKAPYTVEDLSLHVGLSRGVVTLHQADCRLWGASMQLAGTAYDATTAPPQLHVVWVAQHLDVAQLLDAHALGQGRVRGDVDLTADLRLVLHENRDALLTSLQGPASLTSHRMEVTEANLLVELFEVLTQASPVPIPTDEELLDRSSTARFENLTAAAVVERGHVVFTQPLVANTEYGRVQMEGDLAFDGSIDLVGSATLSPRVVQRVTKGAFVPPRAVLVPIMVDGTWSKPHLKGVDVEAFAAGLGLDGVTGRALGMAQSVRDRADQVKAKADALRNATVEHARSQARQAQQDAARRAREAAALAQEAVAHPDGAAKDAAQRAQQTAQHAQERAQHAAARVDALARGLALPPPPVFSPPDEAAQRSAEHVQERGRVVQEGVRRDVDATTREVKRSAREAQKRTQEWMERFAPPAPPVP